MFNRTFAAVLLAAALAVPAAQAATPPDMHASTAIAASKAQDLRSPDARDASLLHRSRLDLRVNAPGATAVDSASVVPPDMHGPEAIALTKSHQTKQDLRSPDARDAATLRLHRSAVAVGAPDVAPGQPTWPANPQPINVAAPAPASPKATDDGIDWMTIGIGVAACMVALGGIGLVLSRRPQRLRTVA